MSHVDGFPKFFYAFWGLNALRNSMHPFAKTQMDTFEFSMVKWIWISFWNKGLL